MDRKLQTTFAGLRHIATIATPLLRPWDNKKAYLSSDVVREFAQEGQGLQGLFKPERAILDRLEAWLTGRHMLDVGVGGGRTTLHFAPIVSSYIGVDYSSSMIEECKARLGNDFANASLAVADVRDLARFESGSFDFVLFSFNGLDSISHVDRLTALAELYRVCSPDGLVCFSAHNICAADRLFHPEQKSELVLAKMRVLIGQMVLRLLNRSPQRLVRMPHALVRDGCAHFRIKNYYIRPTEQLAQLSATGFEDVEVYNYGGARIAPDAIDQDRGFMLYYLAAPKGKITQRG